MADLIDRLNAQRSEKRGAAHDAWLNGGPDRGVLEDKLAEAEAVEREAVHVIVRQRAVLRMAERYLAQSLSGDGQYDPAQELLTSVRSVLSDDVAKVEG